MLQTMANVAASAPSAAVSRWVICMTGIVGGACCAPISCRFQMKPGESLLSCRGACHPVRRALGAVALSVRHAALDLKAVSRAQVLRAVPYRKPHFALHDEGARRKRMGVRLDDRAGLPGALDHLVAADGALLCSERFEGRSHVSSVRRTEFISGGRAGSP